MIITFACQSGNQEKIKKEVVLSLREDSIILGDALFFLNNIKTQKHYSGKKYKAYIDNIARYFQNKDTLERILVRLKPVNEQDQVPDIKRITSAWYVDNFKKVYSTLNKAKWEDHINKEDFRNYILPYKINNASFENWRDSVYNDYLDTVFNYTTISEAAEFLIKKTTWLLKDFKVKFGNSAVYFPDLPYSSLKKIPYGSCKELSDYICYILRAYAIPCVMDFTPNYTNLWSGHDWNAIIDENGECFPFVIPLEVDTLGHFKSDHYRLGKVYRHTFTKNANSHAAITGKCKYLPDFLNDENIKDVTEEYITTTDIFIPLFPGKTKSDIVYLSVYNNKEWQPIAWGKTDLKKQNAQYINVGLQSVYLPVSLYAHGSTFLNYPFILVNKKKISIRKPDKNKLITLHIFRKYPLIPRIEYFINRMKDGYFEVSDHADFAYSQIIYRIKNLNEEYYNEVKIELHQKYRYIRYVSPVDSYCNVAELKFYNENDSLLTGDIIATKGFHPMFPQRTKELAFDNNVLTFFHAIHADSCWIGMDFLKPQKITKISFLPRNANNIIVPGNIYEVFYWDNEWISLGKKVADSCVLIYENVPSNALYFIHCLSGGKEERIFTYEDGKQYWW